MTILAVSYNVAYIYFEKPLGIKYDVSYKIKDLDTGDSMIPGRSTTSLDRFSMVEMTNLPTASRLAVRLWFGFRGTPAEFTINTLAEPGKRSATTWKYPLLSRGFQSNRLGECATVRK